MAGLNLHGGETKLLAMLLRRSQTELVWAALAGTDAALVFALPDPRLPIQNMPLAMVTNTTT